MFTTGGVPSPPPSPPPPPAQHPYIPEIIASAIVPSPPPSPSTPPAHHPYIPDIIASEIVPSPPPSSPSIPARQLYIPDIIASAGVPSPPATAPLDIVTTNNGHKTNTESVGVFTEDSLMIFKNLDNGTELTGDVVQQFPKKRCSWIKYKDNNQTQELIPWGPKLSKNHYIYDSTLSVKKGTRIDVNGECGEVILNEQQNNLYLLKFCRKNATVDYDVFTYEELSKGIASKKRGQDTTLDNNVKKKHSKIDFPVMAHEQEWTEMFDLLKIYKTKNNGSTSVPIIFEHNKKLANWVRAQFRAKRCNQLLAHRRALLDSIDFEWTSERKFARDGTDGVAVDAREPVGPTDGAAVGASDGARETVGAGDGAAVPPHES